MQHNRTPHLIVITLAALLLAACGGGPSSVDSADPEIKQLAWLVGAWEGRWESGGSGWAEIEEYWAPPKLNVMVGMHRDTFFPDGEAAFEFMRIEITREGTMLFTQPQGAPATPFKLVESGPNRAVFENLEHDFPQRITYSREGKLLFASIEGVGQPDALEWTFERTRLVAN